MGLCHNHLSVEKGQPEFLGKYLEASLANLPLEAIIQICVAAKESLLAMSVEIGRQVLTALMEEELTNKVGPKGKHKKNRTSYRNGYEDGSVILSEARLPVKRPRARTLLGEEIELETYNLFNKENPFNQAVFAKMLMGVSCRNYADTLDCLGENLKLKPESVTG